MTEPRLKTRLRVDAHLVRVRSEGAFATIARSGDPDAGAVAVKVYMGGRRARLYLASRNEAGEAIWREAFDGPADEAAVDEKLARETRIDPDLWIVEIEDREGRSFLD